MAVYTGLLTIVFAAIVTINYSRGIIRGAIQPRLATWILFVVGSGLSLITYFSTEGEHSFFANAANMMDIVMCVIVLACLIKRGQTEKSFTPFDKGCLGVSGVILAGWIISREHFMANIALQILLAVSYAPTICGLWRATRNTEAYGPWFLMLAIGCLSEIGACAQQDVFGMAYAGRLMISVALVLALQYRLTRKNKKPAHT